MCSNRVKQVSVFELYYRNLRVRHETKSYFKLKNVHEIASSNKRLTFSFLNMICVDLSVATPPWLCKFSMSLDDKEHLKQKFNSSCNTNLIMK